MNCLQKICLFLLSIAALAGCQNNDPKAMREWNARYGDNKQASLVLNSMPRDDLERIVELRRTPQRIVVMGPGATEMLYALGLQNKIVGRDSASDFPNAARKLPVVGDYQGPSIEKTLAVNPDFVIVQGETYGADRVELWQKQLGVPVAVLASTTLKGVAQSIQKIGVWMGAPKKPDIAQNVAAKMLASRDWPQETRADGKPKTALFEIQRKPLWVAGSGTLIDDAIKRAGFANAARGIDGYKQINLEKLLVTQPDFYIVSSSRFVKPDAALQDDFGNLHSSVVKKERDRVLDELRRDASLKGLKCIQQGRVLIVPADWILRPGPRLAKGISEMAGQRLYLDAASAKGLKQ